MKYPVFAWLLLALPLTTKADKLIDIGSRRELLVDLASRCGSSLS